MEIIPAIDLRHGKCVRLYQGDYNRETVFSEDPVAMAVHWQSQGATRLHLVDLDGAESGAQGNAFVIEKIVQAIDIPIELGGGIRTLTTIEDLLFLGIQRVILGTIAVENRGIVQEACRKFGDGIVIGVDARDGYIATHGWKQKTSKTATVFVNEMERLGATRIIYTDISRDGTLEGPNFEATAELIAATKLPIIASGGVSSLDHLKKLADIGVEGAIVGQALYTGTIDLKQVLASL